MKLLLENWRKYLSQDDPIVIEEGVVEWVKEKWSQAKDLNKRALATIAQEWAETKDAGAILGGLLTGQEISEEEKEQLNQQALDVLKTAGWGSLLTLPGSLAPLALVVYALQSAGWKPLPSAWDETGKGQDETPT